MNGEATRWIEVLNGDWTGPLKLRVQGRSMWPSLHPGDQVTVEPATTDDLEAGDWVLLQGVDTLFLHRFLGFTSGGRLLTKGDGHRALDAPWPPEALRGRAVAVSRHGKTIPVCSASFRERARTLVHRLMAATWSFVRRCVRRAGPLAFLLLGVSATTVLAAVTLVSFTATPQSESILIEWKTGSEVDMFGFYVQRAPYVTPERDICAIVPDLARLSDLIPSKGDIVGAYYAYVDDSAVAGADYYYCLEAVEVDGDYELHGPISAGRSSEPTAETKTLTPTPSPASGPPPPPPPPVTSSPTATPAPTSTPSTTTPPTFTPTRTPTRTPTDTPTIDGDEESTPTTTARPTFTQTPTREQSTVTATPEPDKESSDATGTPEADPGSRPTRTAAPVAQATTISPIASERPRPTPSIEPPESPPARGTANERGSLFPWGPILALIVAAGALILLGGLGLWWMRQKT